MTVVRTDNSKRFHGSGGTGPFTWVWRFLENSDINVYLVFNPDEDNTEHEVRVLLVENEDYILTGAGSYTGGSLTTTEDVINGTDLLVERNTTTLQEVSIRNQGNNFRPEVHEDVFDRLAMVNQDISRRMDVIERLEPQVRALLAQVIATYLGTGMIIHQPATEAETFVDILSANDPYAAPITIGKTDDSSNIISVRPASGTIDDLVTYPIGAKNQYVRFIPRASDNNWIRA